MTQAEAAWLNYAYQLLNDRETICSCEPLRSEEIRWPGYIGSRYKGVLFVGARHNASGLRKAGLAAGALQKYVAQIRQWSAEPRDSIRDARLLDSMRTAYRSAYPIWVQSGGVWRTFDLIRRQLGLDWDEVASVNLARCFAPETGTLEDDSHIRAYAQRRPISSFVKALSPRIVFVAKDNASLNDVLSIPGEREKEPLVVRYSNHWSAKRNGENPDIWICRGVAEWLSLLTA